MKVRLILGGALVLVLFALPVLADSASPAPELRAAIFAAPAGTCAPPAVEKGGLTRKGGLPGAESVCTAHCQDGSTRTCSGTSCSATDSSCPSQQGYCWSNSEGYKYCPVCQQAPCYTSTTCLDGSQVSCYGTPGTCFSVYQCYAHCDGQYHLCPSTPSMCEP